MKYVRKFQKTCLSRNVDDRSAYLVVAEDPYELNGFIWILAP